MKRSILLVFLCLFVTSTVYGLGDTLQGTTDSKDNYMLSGFQNDDDNYGASATLDVGYGGIVGYGHGFIYFDLSSHSDVTLVSNIFEISVSSVDADHDSIMFHHGTRSGVEAYTGNNTGLPADTDEMNYDYYRFNSGAWTTGGGDHRSDTLGIIYPTSTGDYTIEFDSSYFDSLLSGDLSNNGWFLDPAHTAGGNNHVSTFGSSEASVSQPRLFIYYQTDTTAESWPNVFEDDGGGSWDVIGTGGDTVAALFPNTSVSEYLTCQYDSTGPQEGGTDSLRCGLLDLTGSSEIDSVTVVYKIQRGPFGDGNDSGRVGLMLSGTLEYSAPVQMPSTPAIYSEVFTTKPGGGAWTVSDFNNTSLVIDNQTDADWTSLEKSTWYYAYVRILFSDGAVGFSGAQIF